MSPKGTNDRKPSSDRQGERDQRVGPGRSFAGSREVRQTL